MSDKLPETWMWERAREVIERADRMQKSFFQPGRPGSRRPSWEPPVDIFETATELWVQVALPGVEPDKVEVVLEHHHLAVSGERVLSQAFRTAAIHRLEIPHGRFERRVDLPPGRYQLVQRQLVLGCLFLNLTKID
ncbi:MAG: Hsp20/alpha crystallin family protein [Planctomycetota bacterium]